MNDISRIAQQTIRQANAARSWEETAARAETGLETLELLVPERTALQAAIDRTQQVAELQKHSWLRGPLLLQALQSVGLIVAGQNVTGQLAATA